MNRLIQGLKKLNPFHRMSTTEAIKKDCNVRIDAALKLIQQSEATIMIAAYHQRIAQAELAAVTNYLRSLPDEQ